MKIAMLTQGLLVKFPVRFTYFLRGIPMLPRGKNTLHSRVFYSRRLFTSKTFLGWRCSQESWVIFYFHHLNLRTLILWETEQLNLRCCRPTSLWPFLLLYSVQVHTALFWPPKIFRVSHQLAREEDILCDSSMTLCRTGLTPTYFWNNFF